MEPGDWFVGDISDKEVLERFAEEVIARSGRVGRPEDIAEAVLFLCSGKAGFITGENLCIDGGMTRLMIYHGDNGWSLDPDA